MAGCDGWITIKIFQLIFATFCMIYKRVTDDEANKLFYFLQKFSREWPLLNNVTWEENGAIFTDITYGGYIIIIIGLIIGLGKKMFEEEFFNCVWGSETAVPLEICLENFFLILGALLFIAAGALELAALESVEERLVDNAAILGVFSLLTGFLFILDLLFSSKRRKKERMRVIEKFTQSKPTQTEESKPSDAFKTNYPNGNIQNGNAHPISQMQNGTRIPINGVKLFPSSPTIADMATEYPGMVMYPGEPPIIDKNEIKTHEGRIKSTESFLRSEKGYYPKLRKTPEPGQTNFFIPAGYALVSMDQLKAKPKSDSGIGESPTPPGYAKIVPDGKGKPGYVIIPIEHKDERKPPVSTPILDSPEFYYVEKQGRRSKSPNVYRSASMMNSSDVSDIEEPKFIDNYKIKSQKIPLEYLETDSRGRKYILQSEDSSDEPRMSYPSEIQFRPESRQSSRSLRESSKEWRGYPKGQINEAYAGDKESDLTIMSRRGSPYRSRASSPEKPKSILRFDQGRASKRDMFYPKDGRYDSLDSQKIAEDLRNLREITKSDMDLTENLEKENKILKERLKVEKKEKEKLKYELEDRKKLEESEEEKNRRISEREEQYFGIKDLKQSHKDNLEKIPKTKEVRKGAKEVNEKLKQKYLEHESKAAREVQEYRDLIDERFHFLHEEEKEKKRKEIPPLGGRSVKPGISKTQSISDLTTHSKPGFRSKKSDSDEIISSQSTDEEIRLRVETPGSYKSEALFWLGSNEQTKSSTPTSPGSPGYVLYTAQNWPESPSPEDRFQFSAKEAQQLTLGTPPKTPILERVNPDFDEKKNSQKLRLLEFEEVPETSEKSQAVRKGLLVRKVDFPKEPVIEIKKPTVVQGSTSTWRKWLYPKPKLHHTRSVPN